MTDSGQKTEGSLDAPTRHALDWKNPEFYDQSSLFAELERVFDICHGCRRCFSLCNSFPTLFDLIDNSDTMELDGVARESYWDVIDHCYLCDMCYMSKCPYVPPHPWNVDFPHLMLRAKASRFRQQGAGFRDRMLSNTDAIGRFAGIPVITQLVNAANHNVTMRKGIEKVARIDRDAALPDFRKGKLKKRLKPSLDPASASPANGTVGRVALFATCYGRNHQPDLALDLAAIFEHNEIPVTWPGGERCCGMPKLELGDLASVDKAMKKNIPRLLRLVDEGWDIVAPIPSCVLMFKQELPLMYPGNQDVARIRDAIFDPFEYLIKRHRDGLLKTDFQRGLGMVSYHAACHLRVQNIGLKTVEFLRLIPETRVEAIERCSGHNGTYAVKKEFHQTSMKIGRPVSARVDASAPDYFASDCPMAGTQIEAGLKNGKPASHPLGLVRLAYGI